MYPFKISIFFKLLNLYSDTYYLNWSLLALSTFYIMKVIFLEIKKIKHQIEFSVINKYKSVRNLSCSRRIIDIERLLTKETKLQGKN